MPELPGTLTPCQATSKVGLTVTAVSGRTELAGVPASSVLKTLGVAIGGFLTFLLSLGFPPTVPLTFNGMASALAVVALLVIGPLGGLVSVFYAVRIEPLKALRLS